MTNLFIADMTKTIKDTADYPIEEGMIEKLDAMLTEYGVQHFFSQPISSTDGIADNDEDCLNVFYDSKDGIAFALVYMLWCKAIRKATDEMVKKAMKNVAAE